MRQNGIVACMRPRRPVRRFLFDHVGTTTRHVAVASCRLFAQSQRPCGGGCRLPTCRSTSAGLRGRRAMGCRPGGTGRHPARTLGAAARTATWLAAGNDPQQLLDATRRLIFLKGNDSHDYKFSSAVLEDFQLVSPPWRNQFLAASTYSLRGSQEPDNGLIERIRASLA